MNIITVNHYYAGTGDIPPSFQSLDVVMADEAKDIVSDLKLDIKLLENENDKLKHALQHCFDVIRGALR